jgi:hypothetical protein
VQIFFGCAETLFGERVERMFCLAMEGIGIAFARIRTPKSRTLLAIDGLNVHVGFWEKSNF